MLAWRQPLVVGVVAISSACQSDKAAPTSPAPSLVVPPYAGTLVAADRIAALPADQRAAWTAYVDRSRLAMGHDQLLAQTELAANHLSSVIRPPNTPSDFVPQSSWTSTWVASSAGKALVTAVLSYQTSSGGWGKHIDYSLGVRRAGMGYNSEGDDWAYVGTIDNDATFGELTLLSVAGANGDAAARTAFNRGVQYLLDAQFPSGCWPQVWPLMGSYHDAATYNDDATANVVRVLRKAGNGTFAFMDATLRAQATAAVTAGVRCIVSQQIVVNGARTTWCQQHDPLTNAATVGRSYEPPSLAGREGAGVVDLLMEEPSPTSEVVTAVYAATAYYRATAIPDVTYVEGTGLVSTPGAGPVWARMREIGTNRPIFSNRDGIVLYDFNLLTDRRTGYAWYGTEPGNTLRAFDTWAKGHPGP